MSPKIDKNILKKILLIGGIKRHFPAWAHEFQHYEADKFCVNIPRNVEHIVVNADFISHTKTDYLKKFFFGEIHEINGGRRKLEAKLLEVLATFNATTKKELNVEDYFQ